MRPHPPRSWGDGHTHSSKPLKQLTERAFRQDCDECLAYIDALEATLRAYQRRIDELTRPPRMLTRAQKDRLFTDLWCQIYPNWRRKTQHEPARR